MYQNFLLPIALAVLVTTLPVRAAEPVQADLVLNLWPNLPPDFRPNDQPESDRSSTNDRPVAGESVIRLGNVQTPQLHIYLAAKESATDTAVMVCPGGGYSILAWDLGGTEIASWLQSIGVTAAVVKYRVPTREERKNWLAPVQDIQRGIELLRSGAVSDVTVSHVGVLGFSAGGNASARVATTTHKFYSIEGDQATTAQQPAEPTDSKSFESVHADFAVLVYPAWLVDPSDSAKLVEELVVDQQTPPMFFAHARNDRISCLNSVTMFTELQKRDIPAELHVFSDGGHGFGSRPVGLAHDAWPKLCEHWLRDRGWLNR